MATALKYRNIIVIIIVSCFKSKLLALLFWCTAGQEKN